MRKVISGRFYSSFKTGRIIEYMFLFCIIIKTAWLTMLQVNGMIYKEKWEIMNFCRNKKKKKNILERI